MEVKQYQSQ